MLGTIVRTKPLGKHAYLATAAWEQKPTQPSMDPTSIVNIRSVNLEPSLMKTKLPFSSDITTNVVAVEI